MAVRIAAYTALLYQDLIRTQQLASNRQLPPLLPIVLYNGKERWNAPTNILARTPGGPAAGVEDLQTMSTLLEAGLREWIEGVERAAKKSAQVDFLERQLGKRFGELPAWVPQRLQEARPEQLERWSEQLLDAQTLNAVFDGE